MPVDGFNTTLSWSKFKKLTTRPQGSDADGKTAAIYEGKNITPARNGNAIIVKSADVVVSINSRASWVVEAQMTDELLRHEQGHYDITALGARGYYNGLLKISEKNPKALGDSINELNDAFERKIDVVNKRYDEKTDHSRIKSEQEKWNKVIASEKQKADGSLDNLPQ
jgi:hypothetical protein